jgi:hypothetical protein
VIRLVNGTNRGFLAPLPFDDPPVEEEVAS